jgi:hypothetical protein
MLNFICEDVPSGAYADLRAFYYEKVIYNHPFVAVAGFGSGWTEE